MDNKNIHISIVKYRITTNTSVHEVYVEATNFDNNNEPISWAVRTAGGLVMDKVGEFTYEPMPSNRGDKFLSLYRFSTVAEAVSTFKKYNAI